MLEATDRYSAASLADAIGGFRGRSVSAKVAKQLAALAHRRAATLAGARRPVVGVGATATIATDRVKRGRRSAALAVETELGVLSLKVALRSRPRVGLRQHEEQLVSALLVALLAEGCGIDALPLSVRVGGVEPAAFEEVLAPAAALASLFAGERDVLVLPTDAESQALPRAPLIVSGSFDPWHEGHRRLGGVAASISGAPRHTVWFELPVHNAEKASLTPREAWRRAAQFAGSENLVLTRAPLFDEKARLFPGATFVVGADTAERLVQRRFYGTSEGDSEQRMGEALAGIRAAGCHFLVACRTPDVGQNTGAAGATPQCLDDLAIPPPFRDLFTAIPRRDFQVDISASDVRRATAAEWRRLLG